MALEILWSLLPYPSQLQIVLSDLKMYSRWTMDSNPGCFVGKMNGMIFRSLVKVRINVDSLAVAAGLVGASDIELNSLSVHLWRRSNITRGEGEMSVHQPLSPWDEFSVFADTLTFPGDRFSLLANTDVSCPGSR